LFQLTSTDRFGNRSGIEPNRTDRNRCHLYYRQIRWGIRIHITPLYSTAVTRGSSFYGANIQYYIYCNKYIAIVIHFPYHSPYSMLPLAVDTVAHFTTPTLIKIRMSFLRGIYFIFIPLLTRLLMRTRSFLQHFQVPKPQCTLFYIHGVTARLHCFLAICHIAIICMFIISYIFHCQSTKMAQLTVRRTNKYFRRQNIFSVFHFFPATQPARFSVFQRDK
jgi:hypothetical protein